MKLSYILGQLASGELSNLHLAEDGLTIKERKLPTVIRRINAGLNDLHTRFLINIENQDFPIVSDTASYEVVHDNFIEITGVFIDSTQLYVGQEYRLLRPNVLRLMFSPLVSATLHVEYKAALEEITLADVELDTDIKLPMAYLNALLFFVASKSYNATTNAMDGDVNENITYLRKYQDEVAMLINQGIDVEEAIEQDQFTSRGFV